MEMLFSTNLLAIVGAGEQPSLSPRRLCLYDMLASTVLRELNFLTSILAVCMNKKRLIIVLQDKVYIYDSNKLTILETIDTVPNMKGLCAFAPHSEGCYLALPACKSKGSVLVYNTMELYSLCQIDAHHSPLSVITFSSNGMYMATASEQGTIIRVHLVSQTTKSYSLRRGTYSSAIYSLSFRPCLEHPDMLIATSSSGSIHVFLLESLLDQRGRRSEGLLGLIIAGSLTSALESSNHHVFHDAVPSGLKSYAVVCAMKKTHEASDCCASIFVVDLNGYFREYSLHINKASESLWNLERELNLLGAEADSSLVQDIPP